MFKINQKFLENLEKGETSDILEMRVVQLMKNRKKWKFSPTYVNTCGHPSVINTRGECAFCTVQSDVDRRLAEEIDKTEKHLDALRRQKTMHDIGVYMVQEGHADLLYTMGVTTSPGSEVRPRQAAIAAGERWYTPDTPCRHCGTLAPRYVANGMCKGCR